MLKRIFALLLSVIMVMGLIPTSVFAEETVHEHVSEEAETLGEIVIDATLSFGKNVIVLPEDADNFTCGFTAEQSERYRITVESAGSTAFALYNSYNSIVDDGVIYGGEGRHLYSDILVGEMNTLMFYDFDPGLEVYVTIEIIHSYVEVHVEPATCTVDGYVVYHCDYCGAEKTEVLPATHVYNEDGICTVCGASFTIDFDREIGIGDHSVNVVRDAESEEIVPVLFKFTAPKTEQYIFRSNAEDGDPKANLYNTTMEFICDGDDEYDLNFLFTQGLQEGQTVYLEVAAWNPLEFTFTVDIVHLWEYTVVTEPTCTTDGVMSGVCSYCGGTSTEVIPASHTWGDDLKCVVCGENLGGAAGDTTTWSLADGTLTISGTGETYELVQMYTAPWFDYKDIITKIVIEEGVEFIGAYNFAGLENVTEIDIADTVRRIGESAFMDCISIKSVELGENVTIVGDYAFGWCDKLEKVTINSDFSEEDCGVGMFYGCGSLASVELPDNFSHILFDMFNDCISLGNIVLPDSVCAIGEGAFEDCESLTAIAIPVNVKNIYSNAFKNAGLNVIIFTGSPLSVSNDAFTGVKATAYYPAGYSEWTDANFKNYGGELSWQPMEFADIATGSCGEGLSWRLNELGRLFISGEGTMDDYEFEGVNTPWYQYADKVNSIVMDEGITHIGANAFTCFGPYLKKVEIPRTVKSIGVAAFKGCSKLDMKIPNSVEQVGDFAFSETNVREWNPEHAWGYCGNDDEGDNLKWEYYSFNNTLTISGEGEMIAYANDSSPWTQFNFPIEKVDVKEGVTSIGPWSFYGMLGNYTVNMPYSLEEIGEGAFMWGDAIVTIVFIGPAPRIAEDAFKGTMEVNFNYPDKVEEYADLCGKDFGAYKANWISCAQVAAPKIAVADDAYAGTIKITWDKIDGADQYKVFRATNKEGPFTRIGVVIGGYCVDNEVEMGKDYYYYVVATANDKVDSLRSNVVEARASYTAPKITVSNNAASGKLVIKWDKVDVAEKYEVYRATSEKGTYELVKTLTATSWTDTTAKAGTKYYYYVVAVTKDGEKSGKSNTWGRVCDLPAPSPITLSVLDSGGKIKVSWTKVEGATRYQIFRSTSKGGGYMNMDYATGTSWIDTTAQAGTTYYYKVKALHKNSNAYSALTGYKSKMAILSKPTVVIQNIESSGKIEVCWAHETGAVKYEVWRATTSGGTYKRQTTTDYLSWTDPNTTAGKTYYYKVKAIHKNNPKANSALSGYKSKTAKLPMPTGLKLTNVASTGKIKLSWFKVSGAAKYQVYRSTSKNGTYKSVRITTSLNWTDTNTTAGKTYYYKVKAIHSNTNANSALTAYKSRVADLKAPVAKITTASGKPKVSWGAVPNAKWYKIYRSTSKNGTYTYVWTEEGTSWRDITAAKGKTYYYKVIAVHDNKNANSAYSNVVYKKCTK